MPSSFGDDTLGYFTERLHPGPTRTALRDLVRLAKRNKAFDNCRFIGLAIDGTAAGRSTNPECALGRPLRNANKEVTSYDHHCAAGQRLLARAVNALGVRFADYLVVDGEFATAPFLRAAGRAGVPVVARLKENLPEFLAAVDKRFGSRPPTRVYRDGADRVETWDADEFDPWETLHWQTVRVIRYQQSKPDGTVVQADWLTNFSSRRVGRLSLYHMAKSRWEIENQGFNDANNRYGIEHICHHEANSILVNWLLIFLALVIERLYRIRYLHWGTHPVCSAEQLCRLLWLGLSRPCALDSS